MKESIKLLLFSIFQIALVSCDSPSDKRTVKKEVLRLEHNALSLFKFLDNKDSCRKAVLFLDSSTRLDKNCYTCYSNKFVFQNALKNYNEAITTLNECIRLKPQSYDLHLSGGVLYEKIGDTINSKTYFQKALNYSAAKIDLDKGKTFKQQGDPDWYVVRIDQAIILKLLKEDEKANTILRDIYTIEPTYWQDTASIRKSISFFISSDRKQILDSTFR